jgi:hypothetical protein
MNRADLNTYIHAPYFTVKNEGVAEELIRDFRSDMDNVGRCAYMLALLEAHPEKAPEWEKQYAFYLDKARKYIARAENDHVGWNDYWMGRWLIVNDPLAFEHLDIQLAKTNIWAPPGVRTHKCPTVGEYAKRMIASMQIQCPRFRKDWVESGRPLLKRRFPWALKPPCRHVQADAKTDAE